MPYIKQDDRMQYREFLSPMPAPATKGELEYCIFSLMVKYYAAREWNYTNLHDCCYAAQHCADEFRRRFLDKREDAARVENGDV